MLGLQARDEMGEDLNVGIHRQLREMHLFSGCGGGILGGILLGHRTVCAVEIEPYRRKVLLQRQRDGILPGFPIWDDITTFDGTPWRGKVDVVAGGFPCQGISAAGRGLGLDDPRSGLWSEMARVVREVGPAIVFVENSPMLTLRGLGRVLSDLAEMGYDAKWGVFGAHHTGAWHKRDRIFIMANSRHVQGRCGIIGVGNEEALPASVNGCEVSTNASEIGLQGPRAHGNAFYSTQEANRKDAKPFNGCRPEFWEVEPALGRVADGVAHRMDRLAAIGDGQVPCVVALAWNTLSR